MSHRLVPAALLLLGAYALAPVASAQHPVPESIAHVRAHEHDGGVVTIAGRATVSSGIMQPVIQDIAIQDASGGIRIFSRTQLARVSAGDSVIASGTIKRYRGDLELAATRLVVVHGVRRLVTPRELPVDASLIGRYAGQLVRIAGRVTRTGFSEGGQWLHLRVAATGKPDTLTLWVPANHAAPILLAALHPADSLIATGIVTEYRDNAEDPVVFQLVPRDTSDVVLAERERTIPAALKWAALLAVLAIGAALAVGRYMARRHLKALHETEARYRQLLALSPDAVIVHVAGVIRFANPAAARLLGFLSDDALVGQQVADLVHPESRDAFAAATDPAAMRTTANAARLRARLVVTGGGAADVEITASPCVYHDQEAVVLLARDITTQLRYERDLHALALIDELTGLQNRRGFSLFAEQELARGRRSGRTPVLVFADLDGLKQINDTRGHAAGDAALRVAARALRSVLRESDILARWSGDEFVALMGDGGETEAETLGARLDAALATLAAEELGYPVTASVGMSPLDSGLPLAEAMERADAELYARKKRVRRSAEHHALEPVDVAR